MLPLSLSPGRTCSGRVPEARPQQGGSAGHLDRHVPVCRVADSASPSKQQPCSWLLRFPQPCSQRSLGAVPAPEQCCSVLLRKLQKPLSLWEVPVIFRPFG